MDKDSKCKEKIFHSEQEFDRSTLLINAKFNTHGNFFKILGNIGFGQILPITEIIGLELYFENLYDEEIKGRENVAFYIEYPNTKQIRPWKLNIPSLKNKNDNCSAKIETLFKPEIPGSHRLIIKKIDGVQYADYHGLTDRPYKQIADDYSSSFYISSEMEIRPFIIAFIALIVSILAVGISLFN